MEVFQSLVDQAVTGMLMACSNLIFSLPAGMNAELIH